MRRRNYTPFFGNMAIGKALDPGLGQRLMKARQRQGYSIDDLAYWLWIDRTLVHRYETGERSIPANCLIGYLDRLDMELVTPLRVRIRDRKRGD